MALVNAYIKVLIQFFAVNFENVIFIVYEAIVLCVVAEYTFGFHALAPFF